jgi:peptidoglycan/xylan/chitin deacetylase (PgdA/CDA1 family)
VFRLLKPAVKRTLARMHCASEQVGGKRAIVLCYHSIHPKKSFSSVTPELFNCHLAWLSRHCDLVDFSDIQRETRSDRPRVAITFDDGYEDNFHFALPLLRQWQAPATFFLTAGYIDRDIKVLEKFSRERCVPVEDVMPLSWAQARCMHRCGFNIGAHTYSHRRLSSLDEQEVYDELADSKRLIEDRLETRISAMSYPYGKPMRHFTPRTMRMAEDLGYKHAAAVLFRSLKQEDSPLAIPRFYVASDTIEQLRAKIMGHWDYLGWWQEKSPLWAAKLLSPEDFSKEYVRA